MAKIPGASVAIFVLTAIVAGIVAVILQYIWRPILFALLAVLFLRPIYLRIKNDFSHILQTISVKQELFPQRERPGPDDDNEVEEQVHQNESSGDDDKNLNLNGSDDFTAEHQESQKPPLSTQGGRSQRSHPSPAPVMLSARLTPTLSDAIHDESPEQFFPPPSPSVQPPTSIETTEFVVFALCKLAARGISGHWNNMIQGVPSMGTIVSHWRRYVKTVVATSFVAIHEIATNAWQSEDFSRETGTTCIAITHLRSLLSVHRTTAVSRRY